MRQGNDCLTSLTRTNGLDIEDLKELREEIDGNIQDMKDRNQYFADAIEEDKADLLAELDDLEAEEFNLQNQAIVPMPQNDLALQNDFFPEIQVEGIEVEKVPKKSVLVCQ